MTQEQMQQMERQVRAVVCAQLGVGEDRVVRAAHLSSDLGADSFDLIEMDMALETEFGIEIPVDGGAELHPTFGALCDHLQPLVAARLAEQA